MELINCNELWSARIEADYFLSYYNAARYIFMQPAKFNDLVRHRYGNIEY